MKFSLRSLPFECLLLLLWILVIVLVNPLGEFPLNDDWAYSRNVWFLSEEGRFVFSQWPGMTLISHTLTGALFTSVFGFSFSLLRMLTLAFGISFLVLLYRFLRKMEVERQTAAFTSLLILFSPIFLSLSFTFMTEVYFLFFFLVSLIFYHQFLLRNRNLFLILSTLFALITVLTRQTGIIIPVAIGLVEVLRSRGKALRIIRSVFPLATVLAGLWLYLHLLESSGNLSENYGRLGDLVEALKQKGLDYFIGKAGIIGMYLGLFLLPLSIRMIPAVSLPASRPGRIILGFALLLVLASVIVGFMGFPAPNVFYNLGLGPKLLKDAYWGDNISPVLPPPLWILVRVLASLGALALALVVFSQTNHFSGLLKRVRTGSRASMKLLLLLIVAGYLIYLPFNRIFFDRYTLVITVLSAVFLSTLAGKISRGWMRASHGALGLFMLFSVPAVHDFMEWNRARWRGLEYLTGEKNVDSRRIDGGFEFNAWYETGPFNPVLKNEKSWWFVTEDEYVLSCGPIDGFQYLRSFTYTRWLFPGKDSVQVLWHPVEGRLADEVFPVECDCETLAGNPFYLLSEKDSIRFEGGKLRSTGHARSGRYSVRLDQDNPYGFLYRFRDVRSGDRFTVRIWKYGDNDRVQIVAGAGEECQETSRSKIIERDDKGWELLELTALITDGPACSPYGIFLWNAGDGEVWLDDLEISRETDGSGPTPDQE